MKIAVLGAGAFGTALGGILADNGYDIDYYDSKLERESLSEVLARAKCVVLCVPSKAVGYLLPHLPKNIPLIVATKGILGGKAFEDFQDWMVLSGPGFAADIKAGKETILTATDERVMELFRADYMSFDLTHDRNGVLLCGALKNVYALLAGYKNLLPGSEKYEEFIAVAMNEMRAILRENGAEAETAELACGIGDLRLTCDTPSRNYKFGTLFRKNPDYRPEETVEGITALEKIKRGEMKVPESAVILREIMEVFQWV